MFDIAFTRFVRYRIHQIWRYLLVFVDTDQNQVISPVEFRFPGQVVYMKMLKCHIDMKFGPQVQLNEKIQHRKKSYHITSKYDLIFSFLIGTISGAFLGLDSSKKLYKQNTLRYIFHNFLSYKNRKQNQTS